MIVIMTIMLMVAPMVFASSEQRGTSTDAGTSEQRTAQTSTQNDLVRSFPQGVEVTTLVDAVVEDLPAVPLILRFDRLTLGANWDSGDLTAPGQILLFVEAGNLNITDELGIEGIYPPASQLVIPSGAVFSLRNVGPEAVFVLALSLLPTDAAPATPIGTPVAANLWIDIDVGRVNAMATPSARSASQEPILQADVNGPATPLHLFLIRTSWSPGAELPEHVFSGPVGYLGSAGSLNVAGPSGIEGQITTGKSVLFPEGLPNRARNVTDEPAIVLMAGVRPAGEPLIVGGLSAATDATPIDEDTNSASLPSAGDPGTGTMYRGNAARTGEMPGPGPEGAPELRWTFEVKGVVSSTAAVDGDSVYIGSIYDTALIALDAANGTERWRVDVSDGIRSSPAVADGVVYFGSSNHTVYALYSDDGEIAWKFETAADVNSSPAIVDGTVYVTSHDGHLYALDADDGTRRWDFQLQGRSDSSPAIRDGILLVHDEYGLVYALDATDGQELWRFDAGSEILASPLATADNAIVVSKEGRVHALELQSGRELWRFDSSADVISPPSVSQNVLIVTTIASEVHALDVASGNELWRYSPPERGRHASAIFNDTVYISSLYADIYAIDINSGTELWRFEPGLATLSYVPVFYSAPVVVGGYIFVGTSGGQLYSIGGSEGEFAVTPTPAPITEGATVEVVDEGAVLRAAPSDSGVVVAQLEVGVLLTVVGPSERRNGKIWWRVESEEDGATGYISEEFLRVAT